MASLDSVPQKQPRSSLSGLTLSFTLCSLLLLSACAPRSQPPGMRSSLNTQSGRIVLARGSSPSPAQLPWRSDGQVNSLSLQRISFYQATRAQTQGNPNIAACGPNLGPWIQVAVSRELFAQLGCGARVRIELDRSIAGLRWLEAVVYDTMNPRWQRTADILVGLREPALHYGVTTGRLLW